MAKHMESIAEKQGVCEAWSDFVVVFICKIGDLLSGKNCLLSPKPSSLANDTNRFQTHTGLSFPPLCLSKIWRLRIPFYWLMIFEALIDIRRLIQSFVQCWSAEGFHKNSFIPTNHSWGMFESESGLVSKITKVGLSPFEERFTYICSDNKLFG